MIMSGHDLKNYIHSPPPPPKHPPIVAYRRTSNLRDILVKAKLATTTTPSIATALHGINVLGRSVTPTFLSKNRLYLQLSTLSRNEQKFHVESYKYFKISVHGASHPAILRLQGA